MNKTLYLARKAFGFILQGNFRALFENVRLLSEQQWNRHVRELQYRSGAKKWLNLIAIERRAEAVYSASKSAPGGIFSPMQNDEEFLCLLHHVFDEERVSNVMEIGSYNGGSLFCFTRMAKPGGTVISLDLPGGFFGGGCTPWKTELFRLFADSSQKIVLIRGNSHETHFPERIRSELKSQSLDFLFIDGDHTYEGVKQDFEMYSPLVRSGGYIAFHDIIPANEGVASCNVGKLWDELKQRYSFVEFTQSGHIGIGVIRLP